MFIVYFTLFELSHLVTNIAKPNKTELVEIAGPIVLWGMREMKVLLKSFKSQPFRKNKSFKRLHTKHHLFDFLPRWDSTQESLLGFVF